MDPISPYHLSTGITYYQGDYSLEPTFPTEVFNYPYDFYTVKEGDTLQNIAFKFYGNSGYWYYIMERNEIVNPFKEIVPGLILKIPKLDG